MAFTGLVTRSLALFWLLRKLKFFLEGLFLYVHSGASTAIQFIWQVHNSIASYPQTFANSVEEKVAQNEVLQPSTILSGVRQNPTKPHTCSYY